MEQDDFDLNNFSDDVSQQAKRRRRMVSSVVAGVLSHPRSAYENWIPPSRAVEEQHVLSKLIEAFENVNHDEEDRPEHIIFTLDAFCIYRPDIGHHAKDLISLERLTCDRFPVFHFDGILSFEGVRYFVQNVEFRIMTIDAYDDRDAIDLENRICIQSVTANKADPRVYYRLSSPAAEYQRFYTPFLWLARFTKHFVDYLLHAPNGTIALNHFRRPFHRWLCAVYSANEILPWLVQSGRKDFRHAVNAYSQFLWKECAGLEEPKILNHPIWEEIGPHTLTAIPSQTSSIDNTVVTPFVYKCFSTTYFERVLERHRIIDPALSSAVKSRKQALGLTPCSLMEDFKTCAVPVGRVDIGLVVSQGDVVALAPDSDGNWESKAATWYAYVQNIQLHTHAARLDVLWLYHPSDTMLTTADYPFKNELFMSDNCGCDKSANRDAIDSRRVLGKIKVTWNPQDPASEAGFFVRRKYRTREDEHDFVVLHDDDFQCNCAQTQESSFQHVRTKYAIGDTILVHEQSEADRLDPVQIIKFDDFKRRVLVRRFSRRCELTADTTAPPNELVPGQGVVSISASRIARPCQIRTFELGKIITPYDRDGAGDLFYVMRESEEALNATIPEWKQGWDPLEERIEQRLKGLGLFCGGGSFDRGVAEAGAVSCDFAVDWDAHALHTHRANSREETTYFLGSVNDYLQRALAGGDDRVAGVGCADIIIAGSPCQAFSSLQRFRNSDRSLRNASMVASVVSFVDLYSPAYLILENVVNMCGKFGPDKTDRIVQQMVAALVALGYQVQTNLMDAWSFGDPQSRTRVFIIASAPGIKPLERPAHTHAHAHGGARGLALGELPNGLFFGERQTGPTPFGTAAAAKEVNDLPRIEDGLSRICPSFPDHRVPVNPTAHHRACMDAVPHFPRTMGLVQTHIKGLLRGGPREWLAKGSHVKQRKYSRTYSRIDPYGFFPTVLTKAPVQDGIAGRVLHWDENRTLTVMEARRAQGFPDHEVIIGTSVQQLHIVRNSVDRKVAFALGRSLYESWLAPETQLVLSRIQGLQG